MSIFTKEQGLSDDLIASVRAIMTGQPIAEKAKDKTEDNTNDKSDDGEGMDKVQPKALKKKFKDRKDKDIDNDGDTDDSDEYLHNRRKEVSKSVAKDEAMHDDDEKKPMMKKKKKNGDEEEGNDDAIKINAKESVDLDDKNVEKALKHDCATHVKHEEYGDGECIPGMHSLEETSEGEGVVTHYDVMFKDKDGNHFIKENVPVEEMTVIKSMNHGHKKKK